MKQELYVVREDSTIELMNIAEDEIVNMIGSDYYPAIFKVTLHGVEYANVDLADETFEWKRSVRTGE